MSYSLLRITVKMLDVSYYVIVHITRTTCYIDQMGAWYDKRTAVEVVNMRLWEQLKVHVEHRTH